MVLLHHIEALRWHIPHQGIRVYKELAFPAFRGMTMVDLEGLRGGPILPEFCNLIETEEGLELCLAHVWESYVSALRYNQEERVLYADMEYAEDDIYLNLIPHLLPVLLPEDIKAVKAGNLEIVEEFPEIHPYRTGLPKITYE